MSAPTAKTHATDFRALDSHNVDLTQFAPDITEHDWAQKYLTATVPVSPFFSLPIDTLTPTKTIGNGRTNITLIRPTILQTDAATPYASFDHTVSPDRNPAVSVHFQPSAYGATNTATYVMSFTIAVTGSASFTLSAYADGGTVTGTGTKTLSGNQTVSLIFTLPPSAQVYGAIEETTGASWTWYTTSIRYPPIILQPVGTGLQANA